MNSLVPGPLTHGYVGRVGEAALHHAHRSRGAGRLQLERMRPRHAQELATGLGPGDAAQVAGAPLMSRWCAGVPVP